jgi:hypothetical protein
MKVVLVAGVLCCALAVIPASAFGQCRGGGGGGQTAAVAATSGSGTTTVASGQLLTSPGSWAYDMMLQQQMQQAFQRRQFALAVQKAQEKQAKLAKRMANAQKHRAEQAYQREMDRQRRSLAAN